MSEQQKQGRVAMVAAIISKLIGVAKARGWKGVLVFALVSLGALANRYFFGGERVIPVPVPAESKAEQPEEQEPLYFCGRQESIRDAFTAKPWPVKRIAWTIDTQASPLPSEQVIEAFKAAWASWGAALDIEPVYVSSASGAMVRSKFGDYDGSGKVLAWSELADGTTTPKHQLYDRAERWGVFSGSGPGIDLVRVAAHEIGHVLGLVHDDGAGKALMDPVYSRTIRFPTDQDISRALALGYKPAVKPANPASSGTLTFPVSAKTSDVVDALRKEGYAVEPPK